jgi:hypothetical protein
MTTDESVSGPEAEASGADKQPTIVSLGTVKIGILPFDEWDTVALTAARNGDYDAWAAGALDDDSFDTWVNYGPKVREANAAFEEWLESSAFSKDMSRSQRRAYERSNRSRRN